MSGGLHVRTLQEARAVHATCRGCFDGKEDFIVVNHRCRLAAYAFLSDPGVDFDGLKQVAVIPTRSKEVRFCGCVPCRSSSNEGGRDLLLLLFADSHTHTWMLQQWDDTCKAFVELSQQTFASALVDPSGEEEERKRLSILCSNILSFPVSRASTRSVSRIATHVLSYSLREGQWYSLAVKTRSRDESGEESAREGEGHRSMEVQALGDPTQVLRMLQPQHAQDSTARSEMMVGGRHRRGMTRILGMEMIKYRGGYGQEEALLSVLCTSYDPPIEVTDLHCFRVSLPWRKGESPGEGEGLMITNGPWKLLNIDPTTTCTRQCETENGNELVIVSASGITRIHNASGDTFWGRGETEMRTTKIDFAGVPTCTAFVRDHLLLLCGDTGGGIHCIRLKKDATIHANLKMQGDSRESFPVPSSLECLSPGGESSDCALTVVAASRFGPTFVFQVDPASHAKTWVPRHVRKVLDHYGPVVDAVVAKDTGFGEEDVIFTCRGAAHSARITKSRVGCSFEAHIEARDVVMAGGTPDLISVCCLGQPEVSETKNFMLFSFEAAKVTQVLDMSARVFAPTTVPGLDHDAYTVAASSPCPGHVTQVTRKELRLVGLANQRVQASLGADQVFEGGILEHCNISGTRVAASSKSRVQTFRIWNKKIQPVSHIRLGEEVSALELKEIEIDADDVTLLLMGQWHTNAVIIMEFQSMDELLRIDTFGSQPRAMAISSNEDMSFLYVGLNDGRAHFYPFSTEEGALCIEIEEEDSVQIGNSAVGFHELNILEKSGEKVQCIYAHSDIDVVFQETACSVALRQECGIPFTDASLKNHASRVIGSEQIVSLAAVDASVLSNGVAWLDSKGCLRLGVLRGEAAVHTQAQKISRTVKKIGHHRQSQSLVALSEDENGCHWLDVFDAGTMEQKTGLCLHRNYFHTTLSMAGIERGDTKGAPGEDRGRENDPVECVVTGDVLMRDPGMVGDALAQAHVQSAACLYSVKRLAPHSEHTTSTDRDLQLLGTIKTKDVVNCVSTITHNGRALLFLACFGSIEVVDVRCCADRSGGYLDRLAEKVREIESTAFPDLTMKENIEPKAAGFGEEKAPPGPQGRRASGSHLVSAERVCSRPVDLTITEISSAGAQVVCSDLEGTIALYTVQKTVTGPRALEVVPLSSFHWAGGPVHAISPLGEDLFACSCDQGLFILARDLGAERDFNLQFAEACALAYEAGNPNPLRSEREHEEAAHHIPAAAAAAVADQDDPGGAGNNDGDGEGEGEARGPALRGPDVRSVPSMRFAGGFRSDNPIVGIARGNLQVGCTRRQGEMRGAWSSRSRVSMREGSWSRGTVRSFAAIAWRTALGWPSTRSRS